MSRSKLHHITVVLTLLIFMGSCVSDTQRIGELEIFFSAEKLTVDGKNLYADNDSSFVFNASSNSKAHHSST